MLRRSKHLVNGTTLKTIYDALVLPHFDYCALVWDNSLQNKLVKLQNKAARILTDDSYETPSEAVRAKLNWETSQSRREKIIFLFMKETINGNSNNNIGDLFRISCNTSHNLRSSNKVLSLAKPNTNAIKRSFSYKGAVVWNNLQLAEKLQTLICWFYVVLTLLVIYI